MQTVSNDNLLQNPKPYAYRRKILPLKEGLGHNFKGRLIPNFWMTIRLHPGLTCQNRV